MEESLDEKIIRLLSGLPEELKKSVQKRVDFYKSKQPSFTEDEIVREAKFLVRLEMVAYLDARRYLSMYNRRFAEHKLIEHIKDIASKTELSDNDMFSLARIDFDLNGLKALNDLGGHQAGNTGLKMFADILNMGQTTRWLRNFGVDVTASAEGGDEFGLIIFGPMDLRKILAEMAQKYFDEVYAMDASHLINFFDSNVLDNIKKLGIANEIPSDFKFRISCSVGYSVFNETLETVSVSETGKTYEEVVDMLVKKMFEISDKRAREHKAKFKEELGKTNPILSGLYARMSKEVIHLEQEINKRDARIKELEERLKS